MLLDGLGKFGDVSVFEVTANGKDISESVTQIIINQSIFNPFWYSSLFINDTTNLIMNVPLYDGCEFTIRIGTNTGSKHDDIKEYKMVMQNIDDSEQANHMHTSYVINLVNDIVLIDNYTNIIKSFDNERHSSAVSNIGSEYLGRYIETHSSDGGITAIIPSLKPFEAINFIAKTATNNNNADYVFYQRDNNIWSFHSVSKLYSMSSKTNGIEFTRIPNNLTVHRDSGFDYSTNMMQINLTTPDALLDSIGGYYGSKIHLYNHTDKTYNMVMYSGSNSNNFDKNSQYNKLLEDSNKNVVKTINRVDDTSENGVTIAENFDKWVGDRRVFMNSINRNILRIQTLGVAGCWKYLGKTCDVKLPSQQDLKDDKDDPKYTGKFLVTKITQKINRTTYVVNYEMIKLKVNKD